MTGSRHRYVRGVAFVGAVAALAAASCTRPWGTPRTTTTRARPTTTMGHSHDGGMDGMDHAAAHSPRLDHPPTEEQKAAALKFVDETRAAVKADGITFAKLQSLHYVGIGDTVHYVKPENVRADIEDHQYLNPHRVEAFTVFGGKIVAAMYILAGAEMTDVPDIAGSWTIYHDHVLPYRSDDINSDDYFRLGGPYSRHDSPMIHVWLEPNKCGPFAGAGVGEGSCIAELANY
jgi:hypothetical protein